MTFDPSQPTDNTKIRDLSTVIVPNWEAIQGADSSFKPIGINFNNRNPLPSTNDPTPIANAYILYCKEDPATNPELFGRDAAGNILQFTGGAASSITNGHTFITGGLRYQWFRATSADNGTIVFPKAFSAAPFVIVGNESSDNTTDFDFVKPVVASYTTIDFRVRVVRASGGAQLNPKAMQFMAVGPA